MTHPIDEPDSSEGADSQDEVLVAYLDGQLPAEESERIEARLAEEPAVRDRLQSLDRVWNALDVLPRSTASPAFTRSTVEMAAVSTAPDEGGSKRAAWRLPLAPLAALIGLAGGALAAAALVGSPERRALRELPVALHADALENVGSLEFVEELLGDSGKPMAPFRTPEIEENAARWGEVAGMTPAGRRGWLRSQSADAIAELDARVDRFEDRTPIKQEALRELSRQIDRHEQASELREAALAYQAMVGQLTAGEQAELRQSDSGKRFAIIKRSARGWARKAALELSDSELAAFRKGIDELVVSDSFKGVIDKFRRRFPWGRERSPHTVLYGATRFVASDPLSRRPPSRGGFAEERDRAEAAVSSIERQWRDWFDTLGPSLPARVREELANATTEATRARLFEYLLRQAAAEDLQSAFAELSNDQMQQALLLPRDEFVESLSDSSDLFGPGPGGPPDRRPGFEGRRPPGQPRGRGRRGLPGGPPPDGERRGRPPR